MEEFNIIGKEGQYGQLVFARVIRNITYDDEMNTESYEYEKKLRPGFILEISDYFESYYLVKFFTGEKEYIWGTDLYIKKEENNLTYLKG